MLIELLRLIRIKSWKAYMGMSVFGYAISNEGLDGRAVFFLVAMFFYLAFAFAINNCYDTDTDLSSLGKNPVASGLISRKKAKVISYLFALSGLLTVTAFPFESIVIYVLMLLLAYLYSAPPRLKVLPPADMLSHGLFFGALIFLFGVSITGVFQRIYIAIAVSIFFYSCLFELKNHIEDFDADKKAGLRTSATILGRKRYAAFSVLSAMHLTILGLLLVPNSLYLMCAFFPMIPEDAALKHFREINAITVCAYLALFTAQRIYL